MLHEDWNRHEFWSQHDLRSHDFPSLEEALKIMAQATWTLLHEQSLDFAVSESRSEESEAFPLNLCCQSS